MTAAEIKQDTKSKYTFTCAVCSVEYGADYRVNDKKKRYCSETCKGRKRRAEKRKKEEELADRRLVKLKVNYFFGWVARQCKRAGTVEILSGHTAETLKQLHDLYAYKKSCGGYNRELRKSKFHICHIHAAVTDTSLGLLHPANLFVGRGFLNQGVGNKTVPGTGMSLPRSSLQDKWLVSEKDTDSEVLDKVSSYLGKTLRAYVKSNPVSRDPHYVLVAWILEHQVGYLQKIAGGELLDEPTFTAAFLESELDEKPTEELRKIREEIEGIRRPDNGKRNKPARTYHVNFDEVFRLAEQLPESRHKDDLVWLTDVLRVCATFLRLRQDACYDERLDSILVHLPCVFPELLRMKPGKDVNTFRDWLSLTAFEALQGFPVNRAKVQNTLKGYLRITFGKIDYSSLEKDSWRAGIYAEAIAQHRSQVSALQTSALSLDLDYTVSFGARIKPNRPARHIATILVPTPAPAPAALISPECKIGDDLPPF